MRKILQTVFAVALTAFAAAALTDALLILLYGVAQVNPLLYRVAAVHGTAFRAVVDCLGAAAVLGAVYLGKRKISFAKSAKLLAPAILLWFIPCGSFPGILLAIGVIGLVVFQAAGLCRKPLPELPAKYGTLLAICGGLAVAAWGYYLQSRAFDSLHFIWGDWNQYVEHYQHLLRGKANFAQWCAGAGHWNFGVNLVMTAALKVWYAPDTVFVFNALCIASVVPLGYWLSRKCNLSTWLSAVLLILAVFNPVLSNQYLSLFYGFHPIVFFVPVLLGFFIAREYENRYVMAACFILSLLVQETVCVFWAGYAVYLLCCKRWKSGIALFAAMIGLFFFFSSVVIPAAHSSENYSQMFHYAHLGNNMGEVLLSPFTRPGVFWKTVFDRSTICFALAVFVPFLFGIVFKPLMLITLLPIFAGVILQGSPDVKSVMLQYGLECTVFAMIVMILNLKRIYPELRRPALGAVLVSTLLCGWLLGMVPGGRGPLKKILARADGKEMMAFLTNAVSQVKGERILATGKLRGQFQFYHPAEHYSAGYKSGDVIILDLHDTGIEGSTGIESFRRRIAADKRVVPVTYCVWENHTIVMFKVFPQQVAIPGMPFIGNMSDAEFAKFGAEFPIPHKELSMRGFYHNGNNIYRVRINQPLERDIDINLKLDYPGSAKEVVIRFGNGIVPAYTVPAGTVFEFAVPGARPEQQAVNICFI